MAKDKKYGVADLRRDFGSDEQCLEVIFLALHSKECSCGGRYSKIDGRRQYQCSKCRHQIAPTAGTIFHKSDTPLSLWFEAIFRFSNAKSGYSAKQLERDLNVTYKTAWRILSLIRKALPQGDNFLSGIVETDSAYFGGKGDGGKNNQNQKSVMANKSLVMGALERGGNVRIKVIKDNTALSVWRFLDRNVNPITTRLMTDGSNTYVNAAKGYDREAVDHKHKEYVRGDVYVNSMDAFWAHVKRSVSGTHKVVSKKHLQSYLDGFAFHYNNRRNDRARFSALLGALLRPAG
jgi:transposase